jgi:hypothetical protein
LTAAWEDKNTSNFPSGLKRGEIALLISAVSFIATAAGFDVSLQSQGIHK